MPVDMKEMIAEAALNLLVKHKVKKLTVKDIVEECRITRQSFYYHFEDIPDLLRWILEQGTERLLKESSWQEGEEAALRHFFLVAISARPYIKKTMQTNYGEEMERLLKQQLYQMFEQIVTEKNLYQSLGRSERTWVLRYHSYAIMGILQDWTEEDTNNLDQIVHAVYLLLTGRVSPFSG